jgi:hypothetical protein
MGFIKIQFHLIMSISCAQWIPPKHFGKYVSRLMSDMSGNFPYITKDGKFLVFTKEFSSFNILPTEAFVKRE